MDLDGLIKTVTGLHHWISLSCLFRCFVCERCAVCVTASIQTINNIKEWWRFWFEKWSLTYQDLKNENISGLPRGPCTSADACFTSRRRLEEVLHGKFLPPKNLLIVLPMKNIKTVHSFYLMSQLCRNAQMEAKQVFIPMSVSFDQVGVCVCVCKR